MTAIRRITADFDVLIVGGGIAGLWLLNRLVAEGYSVALIERGDLGGGQTVHSQGIIHGGTKYNLRGRGGDSTAALAAMPDTWRACLEGTGDIDLTAVPIVSDETYLWSDGSFSSRLASFFASRSLRSEVTTLSADERPPVFRACSRGPVYMLDECVVDVRALVDALARAHAERIFQLDAAEAVISEGGVMVWNRDDCEISIHVRRIVLTAGQGFEHLAAIPNLAGFRLQKRPLHMVLVEHEYPLPIFGHCIGASNLPLLTVTTHVSRSGRPVWYLGGALAETGVDRTPEEQVEAAKAAVARCVPWAELGRRRWRTLRIDRAEPAQPGGVRPSGPYAASAGKFIVAWPTKLALAPVLADKIVALLPEPTGFAEGLDAMGEVIALPGFAEAPWERLFD